MSSQHRIVSLDDVEDKAPGHGMGEITEARFAREDLGAEGIGLSHYRVKPDQRLGFGHRHGAAEEMYVVASGAGRFKVEDEIFDVKARDVVYVAPTAMRAWEAGPDGLELLAFGAHVDGDAEMQPGWWPEGS